MTKKRIFAFLAFAFVSASLGFSQTGGNGTTSTSTSTNTVNATVVAAGGGQVSAMPGVMGTPGVFPGFPEQNGAWVPYWNGLFREVSVAEMESGRGKHDKVKTDVIIPSGVPDNNNPVRLLDWSPFNPKLFYLEDKAVSVTNAIGKGDEQPEATLLAALYDAKMKSHANRCVAFLREINEGVTTGFSIGTGGSGGMTPGPGMNNETMGFAGGGLLGKNTTRQVNRPEFRVVCLNDGPLDPPQPPVESSKPAGTETMATPPKSQLPSPAPPVQTIRIEVVAVPSAPSVNAPAQTPQLPAPSTTNAPIANCDIPQLTIDFFFARADIAPDKVPIKDEYGSEIKKLATWLENHPACKVLVEGHASTEGSNAYNDVLADNRAKTLYNLLRAYGVSENQLEHASFGKYFPRHEYNAENRRDILVVQGPASGR